MPSSKSSRRRSAERSPGFDKPLLTFRQQGYPDERTLLDAAIKGTFLGLIEANKATRRPGTARSSSASGWNAAAAMDSPVFRRTPPLAPSPTASSPSVARSSFAEFPELCGVEQELVDRCVSDEVAARFTELTSDLRRAGQGCRQRFFSESQPREHPRRAHHRCDQVGRGRQKRRQLPGRLRPRLPGNRRNSRGSHLLCTPGGDAESTTALAGAHAQYHPFHHRSRHARWAIPSPRSSKISTNTELAERLPDLIDFDTGAIIRGEAGIDELGNGDLLDLVIEVASGTPPNQGPTPRTGRFSALETRRIPLNFKFLCLDFTNLVHLTEIPRKKRPEVRLPQFWTCPDPPSLVA
jgi:altronate hydrolase